MSDVVTAELAEKLQCALCYDLIDPPMQLMCCGIRICQVCDKIRLIQLSQCPFCSEPGVPQAKPDKAHQRELQRLKVNCLRCGASLTSFTQLSTHLNKTHRDLPCTNCEETFIFPQQRERHQNEYCIYRVVQCPLACLGCSSKVPYNKLNEHYLQVEHQQCLVRIIQQGFTLAFKGDTSLSKERALDQHYQQSLTQYLEKVNTLLQAMRPVMENCSRLDSERQACETKIKELRTQSTKVKESSDSNTKLLESLHQVLINMHCLLDEIKSKSITGPKLISLDCSYVWNVNVHALSNNVDEITSESFYTSQSGYKMVLKCSVYIDEPSQKQYLSMSFMIFPGEFDAILTWPVPFPITLSIEDLSGKQAHIKHLISKDYQLSVLTRPTNSISSLYRVAKFCPMETLLKDANKYVQDDSIFIRTHIDFMTQSAQLYHNKDHLPIPQDYIQNNILSNLKSS